MIGKPVALREVRRQAEKRLGAETQADTEKDLDLSGLGTTFGKVVALLQIPNQAVFGPKAAAKYLGMDRKTLKEETDLGRIPARRFRNRRAYLLEDLEKYRKNLPQWYDADQRGENPSQERRKDGSK